MLWQSIARKAMHDGRSELMVKFTREKKNLGGLETKKELPQLCDTNGKTRQRRGRCKACAGGVGLGMKLNASLAGQWAE